MMKKDIFRILIWIIIVSLAYLFYSFIQLQEGLRQAFSNSDLIQSSSLENNPLLTLYFVSIGVVVISGLIDVVGKAFTVDS